MAVTHYISADLACVYDRNSAPKALLTTLAWGDPVEVLETGSKFVKIGLTVFRELGDGSHEPQSVEGFILADPAKAVRPLAQNRVLKVDFVDVQQGDAAVLETPGGKVMTIDGGDNNLFARYLAARYSGTSAAQPRDIDCMLISHGDSDHSAGLASILQSEKHATANKRAFIQPRRLYHNGLVKRPDSNRKETEMLGPTAEQDGALYCTDLEDDLRQTDSGEMNQIFRALQTALKTYGERGDLKVQRIEHGDDACFQFLSDNEPVPLRVQVLGPITHEVNGGKGLKFLRQPGTAPRLENESLSVEPPAHGEYSASHTINGHSVVLRFTYGKFAFLFAGDLNAESEKFLTQAHRNGELDLNSEVLKVPHHGSSDFSAAFLCAVSPAVSIVSSGDESERKEYVHPRANLMGALGKYSRLAEPLIFVTELVAFFKMVGWAAPTEANTARRFFAFERSAFGIVKLRTDGDRLMVYTNSGLAKLKEAYAFTKDATGRLVPAKVAFA